MAIEVEELEVGTIKWFNKKKGFGFIKPDDGNEDYFLHERSIVDEDLEPDHDQRVIFIPADSPRGPEATQVKQF